MRIKQVNANMVKCTMHAAPGELMERMAKTKKSSSRPGGLAEVAFYYPGPIWYSGESIKNLLLFFDGVALLVPKYMKGRPEQLDPVLAKPLRKQGLLHLLEPESLVDKKCHQGTGHSPWGC